MRLSDLDGWESKSAEALGLAPELDALEEFHVSWEHTALRAEFAFGRSIDMISSSMQCRLVVFDNP